MSRNWFAGVEALHTVVRVLQPNLYDKVVSGQGEIPPGASVPGAGPGELPSMHRGHKHGSKDSKKGGGHERHH